MWEKLKNVKPATWARTICLLLAFANQILAIAGREALPFAENDIYQTVSLLATLVTGGISWWKNNSFTGPAQLADEYMNDIKSGNTTQ